MNSHIAYFPRFILIKAKNPEIFMQIDQPQKKLHQFIYFGKEINETDLATKKQHFRIKYPAHFVSEFR